MSRDLGRLVRDAHGDLWQAEGRLRADRGGGALELPGARLMASGIPEPQWNNADLTDDGEPDLEAIAAWFDARRMPWGVRVPPGVSFAGGVFLFDKRAAGVWLTARAPDPQPPTVRVRAAQPADLGVVADVDAESWEGSDASPLRAWIEPQLSNAAWRVLLAELDGVPAGVLTATVTDGRAGRTVGLKGLGVVAVARGRGVGTALVAAAIGFGSEQGAVLAHVYPDPEELSLFRAFGFEEVEGFEVRLVGGVQPS